MKYEPRAFLSGKKVGSRLTATSILIILAVLFYVVTGFINAGNQYMAILILWGFLAIYFVVVIVLWALWLSYIRYG